MEARRGGPTASTLLDEVERLSRQNEELLLDNQSLRQRLRDFRALAQQADPRGKFRNAFVRRYVFAAILDTGRLARTANSSPRSFLHHRYVPTFSRAEKLKLKETRAFVASELLDEQQRLFKQYLDECRSDKQ